MSGEAAPRDRRARRRGPRLASALAGAGLLVVLGFALGVVAGLVMEQPDLLLDYVLGRAEQVAVGDGERPSPLAAVPAPDVAARPPEPSAEPLETESVVDESVEAEAAPATAEPAPAEPAASGPPVELAVAAPAGSFAVQVGAFADAAAAERLARRLRGRGHPVYVAPSAGAEAARWRVRVGPLASRAEAEGVAARLEQEERLSTWVLAEGPR